MNAGLLNEYITIEKLEIENNEDFGSQESAYTDYLITKARVIYNTGNKTNDNNEVFFTSSVTFEIRLYNEVDESMRISFKDKKYRILSIIPDKHTQKLIIQTELIND